MKTTVKIITKQGGIMNVRFTNEPMAKEYAAAMAARGFVAVCKNSLGNGTRN